MPVAKEKSPFEGLQKLRAVEPAEVKRGRGQPRKPGAKRNDPEYRAWTGYLKRDTVTEAEYLLKKARDGRTISDLLEELVSGWVEQQKA